MESRHSFYKVHSKKEKSWQELEVGGVFSPRREVSVCLFPRISGSVGARGPWQGGSVWKGRQAHQGGLVAMEGKLQLDSRTPTALKGGSPGKL